MSDGPRSGFFWIGDAAPDGVPHGPMFVQWELPAELRRPHPIVLIHGGGGQGTDYLGTPDGRPGWAQMLVEEGFAVYVVDRPGHGRSPLHPDVLGAVTPPLPYAGVAGIFRPDPAGHPQWPGTGGDEDPVLLQFLAGSGPMLADFAKAHALEGARGAALLDHIGPAILVSHSAGGPTGFMTTDLRPELVRAHVAIEVMGPPFAEMPMGFTLDWGVTAAPVAYDPPVADPADLQDGTRRRLANISAAPIAVMTAPESPFLAFDGATLAFLRDAGCDADLVRLADHGVHGNGHGMMWESNNREVLGVVLDWLTSRGLG